MSDNHDSLDLVAGRIFLRRGVRDLPHRLMRGRKGELVSDLIDRKKLLKEMSDWQFGEAPFLTPDVALEYTAKEMQTMIYRTIKDAMLCVADQPAVMTWIPVTERLPEHEDHVLCCTATAKGRKNIVIGYYCRDLERWASGMNSNVIAWMELPEPYKEPEDPSHPCADSVMMGD